MKLTVKVLVLQRERFVATQDHIYMSACVALQFNWLLLRRMIRVGTHMCICIRGILKDIE